MVLPFFQSTQIDLLDRQHSPDLHRIKAHFRRLQQPEQHTSALATLDRLANAYRFRHFSRLCGDNNRPVLEHFHCPENRRAIIGAQPANIMQHLHTYEQLLENRMQWSELIISRQQRRCALALANRHTLFSCNQVFSSFDELCQVLDIHQRMALLCTCELQQHCLGKQADQQQRQFFHSGVESGCIALLIAGQTRHSPLAMYLCSLLHHISLLYIHRSLAETGTLPEENRLLDHIQQLDRPLPYWIAKDWGFPDRLLQHLKQRTRPHDAKNSSRDLLDKSDHACLLLTLQYRQLLSKRQARRLLQYMQLPQLAERVTSSDLTVH